MSRLRRGDREDLSTQPHLFEPARNGALEHPRPAWTETSAGDDKHAAPPGFRRAVDERGERVMRFGLGLSVQIETGLDRVVTTLQPLGIGAIDSRKMLQGWMPNRLPAVPFLGCRRCCRA